MAQREDRISIEWNHLPKSMLPFFRKKEPPQTLIPRVYIELLCRLASQAVASPGDLLEVGVYKGGSLYRIADHVNANRRKEIRGRKFFGIDTFSGHPYHDPEHDPKHHFTGRFSDTSYEAVRTALRPFRFVEVLKGECGELFAQMPLDQRFCFAHIDVDIGKSAMISTEYVYPRLSPGGILIYDEYRGYAQEAFLDSFFKDKPVKLEERSGRSGDDYGLIVYRL